MKLDFDSMRGGLSIENNQNFTILRHLYKYDSAIHRCLIRIYEFKTKTIVIASQLDCPPLIWDERIISKVIQDFKLDTENLIWIVHVGLFSNFMPPEEEFLLTFFSEREGARFQSNEYKIIETINIDIQQVKKLIERPLEPVKKWLGLDIMIQNKRKEQYQKRQEKLLHLYLQNNLEFLFKQDKLQELLPKTLIGAFFFYPERKENDGECIKFIGFADLEKSNDKCEKLAFSYVTQYLPDKEIVICICTEESYCYCTRLSKKSFLMSKS